MDVMRTGEKLHDTDMYNCYKGYVHFLRLVRSGDGIQGPVGHGLVCRVFAGYR